MISTSSPSSPRRRAARSAVGLVAGVAAACAAVATGTPSPAAAADPPDLIRAHKVVDVRCVPAPQNTVRARVKVRMTVVNYEGFGGDWADHMEAKARLVPTTVGLNFLRSWRSVKSNELLINRRHVRDFTVVTDSVSGTREWKVQIKLIWHRKSPTPNIAKTITRRFSGDCAVVTGGMNLPAAPALPSD